MKWRILYYNRNLEQEILNLPDGLLARYLHLADLMIEFGSNLGLPHTKAIDKGLFELRIKSKEGIARVFFLYENRKKDHNSPFRYQKISKDPEART